MLVTSNPDIIAHPSQPFSLPHPPLPCPLSPSRRVSGAPSSPGGPPGHTTSPSFASATALSPLPHRMVVITLQTLTDDATK